MKPKSDTNAIIERLDILITSLEMTNRLLALQTIGSNEYIKDRIVALLDWKFKPVEVAFLLGVSPGTVSKAKSRAEGRTSH